MNIQQSLMDWFDNQSFSPISIVMMAVAFWILGVLDTTSRDDVVQYVGWSVSTNVFSDGQTSYSVANLILYCKNYVFPSQQCLTEISYEAIVDISYGKGLITAEEKTALEV